MAVGIQQRRGAGPSVDRRWAEQRVVAGAALAPPVQMGPPASLAPPLHQMLNLTENLPGPSSIQKQKENYAQALEAQLSDGADQLGGMHRQKTDYLHAVANQQKHQFNIMLDQQVKEQEMTLLQEYNQQLMKLRQAAQGRRAELETSAHAASVEWQQRKVKEEFFRQQAGIEAQYAQAQGRISDQIQQIEAMHPEVRPVQRMTSGPQRMISAPLDLTSARRPSLGGGSAPPSQRGSFVAPAVFALPNTARGPDRQYSAPVPLGVDAPQGVLAYVPPTPGSVVLGASYTSSPCEVPKGVLPYVLPSSLSMNAGTPRTGPRLSYTPSGSSVSLNLEQQFRDRSPGPYRMSSTPRAGSPRTGRSDRSSLTMPPGSYPSIQRMVSAPLLFQGSEGFGSARATISTADSTPLGTYRGSCEFPTPRRMSSTPQPLASASGTVFRAQSVPRSSVSVGDMSTAASECFQQQSARPVLVRMDPVVLRPPESLSLQKPPSSPKGGSLPTPGRAAEGAYCMPTAATPVGQEPQAAARGVLQYVPPER